MLLQMQEKMIDNVAGPSELHLMRELSALRKVHYLRDPETFSSLKSPVSGKSLAATSDNSCDSPVLSALFEKRRKKVYLNNWHEPVLVRNRRNFEDIHNTANRIDRATSSRIQGRTNNPRRRTSTRRIVKKNSAKFYDIQYPFKQYHEIAKQFPASRLLDKVRNGKWGHSSDADSPAASTSRYRRLEYQDYIKSGGRNVPKQWSRRIRNLSCSSGCYSPSRSESLNRKTCEALSRHPLMQDETTKDLHEDGISEKFEIDLEASSRFDETTWLQYETEEVFKDDLEMLDKSLSQKYMPKSFVEIVGHEIIVQSLRSSMRRGKLAPAYLFHGPRGTGKSSTARIFAAAMNCLSSDGNKPCGCCRGCAWFATRCSSNMGELKATNKKDLNRIAYTLENMSVSKFDSRYEVFIIDECHSLPSKIWFKIMKFLDQEHLPNIVFIFITVYLKDLPESITAVFQKYAFCKIKDTEIVCRLKRLSSKEKIKVDMNALELIANYSDGSLWDAEMMLDQLSLLGKRITTSLVNELVGVVPKERLLDLLKTAISNDAVETVKKSRELMDTVVDLETLMSQLISLVVDIISGSNEFSKSFFQGTQESMQKLLEALKILSNARIQLKHSSEPSTWFTAALLQLGSQCSTGKECKDDSSLLLSQKDSVPFYSSSRMGERRANVYAEGNLEACSSEVHATPEIQGSYCRLPNLSRPYKNHSNTGNLHSKQTSISSKLWEDDLANELQELKINESSQGAHYLKVNRRIDQYPVSPSFLHWKSFGANIDKLKLDYDLGIGGSHGKKSRKKCGCIPCFKNVSRT